MNIVRGVLIALLVAGLTLFSAANSIFVPVDLGFLQLTVWLPLLVLAAFALGFLPVWLWLTTDRMLLRRKLAKLEAALGRAETDLAQARVELLRPPAPPAPPQPMQPQAVPQPAPPPGT
jgi:uncharacterized integral membrane protein